MKPHIVEKDWKYLQSIKQEMLNCLCLRINKQAESIINITGKSDHEKYLDLYEHIKDSDEIVADCFNDWRRSNIGMKIACLLHYDLLKEKHIQNLTAATQNRVENSRGLFD